MTLHTLKVYTQFWEPLASGAKPFEVRRNDRGFKAGDNVTFRRFDPKTGIVDAHLERVVTYVLAHEDFDIGLRRGFVVLGLADRATVAEAQRLRDGIEALYDYVATKRPEADDVLDEIRDIISTPEVENGP